MKVNMIILNSKPIWLKNNLTNFAALSQKVRSNIIKKMITQVLNTIYVVTT